MTGGGGARRSRWRPGQTWRPDRDDDPVRVGGPEGGPLDQVARSLGAPTAGGLAALYERWADVVGEAAADHATPAALRGGRLVVEVDHAAWATSLAHLERSVLEKVAAVAGPGLVTGLDLRVKPRG